jgi:hypothetical protein
MGEDRTIKVRDIREGQPEYVPNGDPPVYYPLELEVDCNFALYPGDKLVEESRLREVETELREAREALRELFDATEASEECWVLSSVLARARGVLEKDKEDTRA